MSGGLWPPFEYSSLPVSTSSTASQTVTNMSSSLLATRPSLAYDIASAAGMPWLSSWRSRVLARIMNRAAGTPLPETSAMSRARWPSSTMKKS